MNKALPYILIVFALLVGSCVRDRAIDEDIAQYEDKNILIHLNAPGNLAISRASEEEVNGEIKNLYMLVVSNNMLVDVRQGRRLEQTAENHDASFTVAVPPGIYDLIVLANAEGILEDRGIHYLRGNNYAEEVLPNLYAGMGEAELTDQNLFVPMWGEHREVNVGSVSTLSVPLTRMLARVEVGVGTQSLIDGTWNGLDAEGDPIPFVITSAELWKFPHFSSLIPNGDGTLPAVVDVEDQVEDYLMVDEAPFGFYAPEAVIHGTEAKERIAIIVGGSYNGGQESFYRIDFVVGSELRDILRNHLYQVRIRSVSGEGSPTAQEAYDAVATNITAQIVPWNRIALDGLNLSGSHYFSIDEREIMLQPVSGDVRKLTIRSSLSNFCFAKGEGEERIEFAAGKTVESGNYKFTISEAEGDEYELTIEALGHNVSASPVSKREEWTIEAANMRIPFIVDQRWTDSYISVMNGQTETLYPEGGVVPVEIVSRVPVTVSVEGSAPWLSGVADATSAGGHYTASLQLTAGVHSGGTDRSATIVIREQGKPAIYYTILQQAPYLRVTQQSIILERPATPDVVSMDIEVESNLPEGAFTLSRKAGSHAQITLEKNLYVFDDTKARYRRFTVAADFSGSIPDGAGGTFVLAPSAEYAAALGFTELPVSIMLMPGTPVIPAGAAPYILYMDGTKLNLGRWGAGVTQANMVFTKFGSTVGFLNNNDAWAMSKIVFEPSVAASTAWENIPYWNGTSAADGYITSDDYHNDANLREGRGDICKLVGLTSDQAHNLAVSGQLDDYDSGFRLPKDAENMVYASGTEFVGSQGSSGRGLRIGTNDATFLPAAGRRGVNSLPDNVYSNGDYWSSRPYSDQRGYRLFFTTTVDPSNNNDAHNGFAMRCVPKDYMVYTVTVAPNNATMGTVSTTGGVYAAGSSFSVTATPNGGYKFLNWTTTGDVTLSSTTTATTTVTANGAGTVKANFVTNAPAAVAPYIMYWDVASQTMALGAWGGAATRANMLYFKFGSVVGFHYDDAWTQSKIVFEPSTTKSTTYTNIPSWATYSPNSSTEDGYISNTVHTLANVQGGWGDPCKLVGLTVSDIANGVFDNNTYRLPTDAENAASYGAGTEFVGTVGSSGYGLRIGTYNTTFLPAAGIRGNTGSPANMYNHGGYWLSRPYDATRGYYLYFGTGINPQSNNTVDTGSTVRCVSQQSYAVTIAAGTGGTVTNSGTNNYHAGMVMQVTATPSEGYVFKNWTATGSVTLADPSAAATIMTVNGAGTVTANFIANSPSFTTPTAPYILYWDGARMQLGAWGGKVTQANMMFFQFGSVVGFHNNNDAWAANKIVFNPTSVTDYTSLPKWNGTATTDGYISSAAYHNQANTKAGRGDPCKLAGGRPG